MGWDRTAIASHPTSRRNEPFLTLCFFPAQELLQWEQKKASALSQREMSTVNLEESGVRTRCCQL